MKQYIQKHLLKCYTLKDYYVFNVDVICVGVITVININ